MGKYGQLGVSMARCVLVRPVFANLGGSRRGRKDGLLKTYETESQTNYLFVIVNVGEPREVAALTHFLEMFFGFG